MRQARRVAAWQSDLVEQLLHASAALPAVADAVDVERLPDCVGHRLPGIERCEGVLEHHLYGPEDRRALGAGHHRHLTPLEADATRARAVEAGDHAAERRLAGTGLAHQADRLTRAHGERDAVHRTQRSDRNATDPLAQRAAEAELLGEALGLKQRGCRVHSARTARGGPRP